MGSFYNTEVQKLHKMLHLYLDILQTNFVVHFALLICDVRLEASSYVVSGNSTVDVVW